MVQLGGFWSYAHADDEADAGRVTDLGRDIVAQYEMLTGESIELFLDRDSLEWGELWRERVDHALASVAFFCPIVTPRYFQSAECRRELRSFADRAEALGLTELIMPILYVDFPALHEESQVDEHMDLVKKYQWEDWTSLRFEERSSGGYRLKTSELAQRLAAANRAAENRAPREASGAGLGGSNPFDVSLSEIDEAPGVLDLIAEMEEAFPTWTATTERIGEIIVDLGTLTAAASEEMASPRVQAKGFAGRVNVARGLARELDQQGEEIIALGNEFARNLSSVDLGVRAIVESSVRSADDPDTDVDDVLSFFDTVIGLSGSAREGLASIDEMLSHMEPLERMSRDLRPVLRKYRQGLTAMTEGVAVSDEWVQLIEHNPVYRARDSERLHGTGQVS